VRRLIVIFAICAGVLWGGPAGADSVDAADAAVFDRAWAAFKRGDLAEAWDGFDVAARNFLGSMYEDGVVVSRDYVEAVKWYRQAAERGVAEAQVNLGFMYAEGRGVSRDYGEAMKWYRQAARQGAAKAQLNIAIMYQNGWGVAEDDAEALKWTRKAARQGYADAQLNLGFRYAKGQGVARDLVRSHMWSNLAAAQGAEMAMDNRAIVAATMTPDQIAEAQRLARDWKPGE
jgi:hypothetical protein